MANLRAEGAGVLMQLGAAAAAVTGSAPLAPAPPLSDLYTTLLRLPPDVAAALRAHPQHALLEALVLRATLLQTQRDTLHGVEYGARAAGADVEARLVQLEELLRTCVIK